MARQPLTAYLLARRITSVDAADRALRELGEELDLPADALSARLFVTTAPPSRPPWAAYLEAIVRREVPLPSNSSNGAVLLVEALAPNNRPRVVAFVFGSSGQHFLKRSWIEHGFGLRCVLNACFPRGMPAAALNSLRSIDSKAFDEVGLDTRQLASREVGFEVFGMNIRTDLLRAALGTPVDTERWGSRVRGHDSFSFSALSTASLTRVARDLLRLWHATDYRDHFPWVDNIKPVRDDELIARLEAVAVEAIRRNQVDLVGPESLDLDRTRYYRLSGDSRANRQFALDLRSYVRRVGDSDLTIERIKRDQVRSYDDDALLVSAKSVFECLAGDLRYGGGTYVLSDGQFYEVDRNFLRELDREIDALPIHDGLPTAQLDEHEGIYNARAAAASPDHLLVDTRTIQLDGRTTPVEPCDLFSRSGALIHVKRHVRSSTLSHLFSQGAVAGELIMTSDGFRSSLRDLLESIEADRITAEPAFGAGIFECVTTDAPERNAHEIVFAIIAPWGARTPANVLPFFSKLNLRQRADDLSRLGLQVSIARIADR